MQQSVDFLKKLSLITIIIISLIIDFVSADEHTYKLTFIDGTFFGPGSMVDSPMPQGSITNIEFDSFLTGKTPFFNNGDLSPNIQANEKFPSTSNAQLSNQVQYNEFINGGIVDIGLGAMSLINLVTSNGPNNGIQYYNLDEKLNWVIQTDLAMDPGFEQGLLVINNISITTGVIWIPESIQSQMNIPGGIDFAGTLPAGSAIVGELGDGDNNGYLDGTLIGVAVIPIDHVFSPGSPAVQSRKFTSNIPIKDEDAIILMIAGLLNYESIWKIIHKQNNSENLRGDWGHYFAQMEKRFNTISALSNSKGIDVSEYTTVINENLNDIRKEFEVKENDQASIDAFKKANEKMFSKLEEFKLKLLEKSTIPSLTLK